VSLEDDGGTAEEVAVLKFLAITMVLSALVVPALADEYWVVLDPSTEKCSVVQQKSEDNKAQPPANTVIDVPFPSQAAAEDSIPSAKKCGRD
jgi:hypothetical protein